MNDEPEARELEAMTRGRDQALDLANRRHGEAIRAVERERAAIVAWLRADVGKTADDLRRLHARKLLTPGMTTEWQMLINLKKNLADAIERGDHMKEREG